MYTSCIFCFPWALTTSNSKVELGPTQSPPSPQTPTSMSQFRSDKWDPVLIVGQMAAMQSAFYLIQAVIVLLLEAVMGSDVTLGHILDYKQVTFDNVLGWGVVASHLLASVAGFVVAFIW